jgi:lysophospholipase L1-like esterase
LYEAVQKVIVNERAARKVLIEFLDSAEIPYVDTLPALKQAVGRQLYAQTTRDMHPGKNGYRVIGETVAQYLTHAYSHGGSSLPVSRRR